MQILRKPLFEGGPMGVGAGVRRIVSADCAGLCGRGAMPNCYFWLALVSGGGGFVGRANLQGENRIFPQHLTFLGFKSKT